MPCVDDWAVDIESLTRISPASVFVFCQFFFYSWNRLVRRFLGENSVARAHPRTDYNYNWCNFMWSLRRWARGAFSLFHEKFLYHYLTTTMTTTERETKVKLGLAFSNDAHARSYKLEGGCWVGEENNSLFIQSKPTHKTGFYSSTLHPFRKFSAFKIKVTLELSWRVGKFLHKNWIDKNKAMKASVAKSTLELPNLES